MQRIRSIKRLIFFINYLFPLLILIGAFAIGSFNDILLNAVYIILLVLAFIILLLLNRKKFIHSYHLRGNDIEIGYNNVFFKSKKKIIPITDLYEIEKTKKKLIGKYSCLLHFTVNGKLIKYEVLDTPLKNFIISHLPAARLQSGGFQVKA